MRMAFIGVWLALTACQSTTPVAAPTATPTAAKTVASPGPFESKEGRFSMGFPSAPAVSSETLDTPAGKVPYHTFSGDLPEGGVLVAYGDYADDIPAAERLQSFVEGTIGGSQVISQRPVTLGAVPGREVTLVAERDGYKSTHSSRTFVVGKRVYHVSVFRISGATMSDAAVKELLDTFRLK